MKKLLSFLLVVASLSVVILPYSAQADGTALPEISAVAVFSGGPTVTLRGFSESLSIPTEVAGARAGKPTFGPAVLVKNLDVFTPTLFLDLLQGTHIQNVLIRFYKIGPDGAQFNYFQIQLFDVRVASIDIKEQVTAPTTEEVRLTFSKIKWTSMENGATAGWDVKANRPFVTSE